MGLFFNLINKLMTAIDWLEIQIKNEDHHTEGELGNACIDVNTLLMLVEQAKEMHKQEIIDAWENGQDSFSSRNAEQYYQETFVSKGSGEVELPQQETLYTEEQVREAIRMAWEADSIDGTVDLNIVLHYGDNNDLRTKWSEEEIIQSLKKLKK
jgi:hypothetical protein